MKKQCFKCLKIKELDAFYKHKQMGDGHLGKCIGCTKKDARNRYRDPEAKKRIQEYERTRYKNPFRKEKIKIYLRKRRVKHPMKARANNKVSNALRSGKLKRQSCEVCGEIKTQAHHTDYRKPFQIKWLCFKHHRQEHGQMLDK